MHADLRSQIWFDVSFRFHHNQANLTEANLTTQKQSSKVELLTREYYELKAQTDVTIGTLEAKAKEQDSNLSSYESLEKELDDVIMHAAESDDPNHALVAYGYGSNVPSMAKRRLKQSILLARRLMASQKDAHKLAAELQKVGLRATQLEQELSTANSMLDKTSQPYRYMIDGMRSRDQVCDGLREQVASTARRVEVLEAEKLELLQVKNAMSADLEHLLMNRQELVEIKRQLSSMQGGGGGGGGRKRGVAIQRGDAGRRDGGSGGHGHGSSSGGGSPARSSAIDSTPTSPSSGVQHRGTPITVEGVGAHPWWFDKLNAAAQSMEAP